MIHDYPKLYFIILRDIVETKRGIIQVDIVWKLKSSYTI